MFFLLIYDANVNILFMKIDFLVKKDVVGLSRRPDSRKKAELKGEIS
jgi:hypothetical protein